MEEILYCLRKYEIRVVDPPPPLTKEERWDLQPLEQLRLQMKKDRKQMMKYGQIVE